VGSGRGRYLAPAVLILLVGCASPPPATRLAPEHVVIVSIDGLRPDFYLGGYDAPTLGAMVANGAHARAVESVYPSSTYPGSTYPGSSGSGGSYPSSSSTYPGAAGTPGTTSSSPPPSSTGTGEGGK